MLKTTENTLDLPVRQCQQVPQDVRPAIDPKDQHLGSPFCLFAGANSPRGYEHRHTMRPPLTVKGIRML
jgi:hypothetical protein